MARTTLATTELDQAAGAPEPNTAEVRSWARAAGLPVPDRGRLRPDICRAWHEANDPR
ncbi:Lsr2 dimerization domain-containing protein [Mycolicibacterium moriokaense]|uniref:Lsr2 family DNA-binding protein n=1 Tax=Mycolicibacterium moriokaense TaxID=39691 RepID=UPI0009F1B4DC|nr:Lsr2 family protein [Mycolicibacterium moriokaense]